MIKLQRNALMDDLDVRVAARVARLRLLLNEGEEPPAALLSAYRDPELKGHLVDEAHGKCMYCESKITHVYFGDVEHIRPKARFPEEQLDVANLGLSCALCNNAKGDFWDDTTPFLNPYVDEPEQELLALGFVVARRPGCNRARITIEKLNLNRPALVERRKERIELLQSLADQYVLEPDGAVKNLLRDELLRHAQGGSEYAFIVRSYLEAACDLKWQPD